MRGHAWLRGRPWAGAAANSVCAARSASTPKHVIESDMTLGEEQHDACDLLSKHVCNPSHWQE